MESAFVILNHSSVSHMPAHRLSCEGLWRRGETLLSRNPHPAVMISCRYQTPAHSPYSIMVNPAQAALYQVRTNVESRLPDVSVHPSHSQQPQPREGHTADTEILSGAQKKKTTWEASSPFKRRPG